MSISKPTTLIAVAVLAAAAAAYWFADTGSETTARQIAGNGEGGVVAVAALARIEPASEIIDVAASITDRLEKLVVEEGEVVEPGQELAILNSYNERRAERDHIAAKLAQAERLMAAEKALGATRIADAEIRVRRAKSIYPLRIEGQRAKIRGLEAELFNSRDILKSRSRLKKDDFGSRRSVDDQRAVVRQKEEGLLAARVELQRLEAAYDLDRREAQNARAQAKADMGRAVETVGVEALRNQLALAEQGVERAIVRAPIAGEILKIMIRPGESTEGRPILKMGDTRVMHAVAEVYETDVKHVKLGQPARIESPALSRPLTGRVVKIGRMIFKNDVLDVDPGADADARVVEVRIELEPDPMVSRLTNLTADVVIDVSGGGRRTAAEAPARQ